MTGRNSLLFYVVLFACLRYAPGFNIFVQRILGISAQRCNPKTGWNEFEARLPAYLIESCFSLGFADGPNRVQKRAITEILKNRDIIVKSKTGSGKTLAYSLPLLSRLDLTNRNVQALILCPTRELSNQVAESIRKLGSRSPVGGLRLVVLVGGVPGSTQKQSLETGAHIVVGTPGRVLDFADRRLLSVDMIRMV